MNNKDIQTLIEMEADKKYLNLDDDDFLDFSDQEKLKAFKHGANFALSLFKWRKVSEGLPEVKEEPYPINIRVIGIPISTCVWNVRDESDLTVFKNMKGCEWMPIPQID